MTYHLTTLEDVFRLVPADKIELCMAEIGRSMALGKAASIDLDMPMVWPDVIEWVDDGKEESGFVLTQNGKEVLTATMKKRGE